MGTDPSQLVRCDALPVLPATVDMGIMTTQLAKIMAQYQECAVRHDCLIQAVDDGKPDAMDFCKQKELVSVVIGTKPILTLSEVQK